jgi:NAD(P)-dependent dehydrogenase (short-subunit alcohol dehydrogenase family)
VLFGAGPALGLEVGRRLAAERFTIHLVGRTPERVGDTATRLRASGAPVREHLVDLADPVATAALVSDLRRTLPPIDVALYAPGDTSRPPVAARDLGPDELASWLPLHLLTPIAVVRELLPAMRRRGHGAIVVAQGDLGVPSPATASAGIPQAALRHYLRDLHDDLRAEGSEVRLASLQIGGIIERSPAAELVDTGWFAEAESSARRRIAPEQLAELVWRIVLGDERLLDVRV